MILVIDSKIQKIGSVTKATEKQKTLLEKNWSHNVSLIMSVSLV